MNLGYKIQAQKKESSPKKGEFLPDHGEQQPVKVDKPSERDIFEQQINKFPPSKRELYRLLRWCGYDQVHTFTVHGPRNDALKFIASMRTHLSRLRQEAHGRSIPLQLFSIKVVDVVTTQHAPDAVGNRFTTKVSLKKTKSDSQAVSESFFLIMDQIKLSPEEDQ